MKKLLLTFMMALATMCVSAQSLGDVPETVSADDVTVLKERVLVFASHDSIVVNAETGKIDTLKVDDGMKFFTPQEFEQLSKEPKRLRASVVPGEQWGPDNDTGRLPGVTAVILYTYKYPSVDADGNAIALPFAKGFGWGAELNLRYIFEKLLTTEGGQGYPKERVIPEQRNKKILDGVKAISHRPLIDVLKEIDRELLVEAISRPSLIETLKKYGEDGEVKTFVLSLAK
jgi:hypothetical protein